MGGPNIAQMQFPFNRYFAHQCPYVKGFKSDPRCNYSGVETWCNGLLDRCVALGNQENWGGFLGLDQDASLLVLFGPSIQGGF